jgi:hypothetical protein
MEESKNKGKVKVGEDFYTWKYDEGTHVLEVWNKDDKSISKEKVEKKDFEELAVTAFIKRIIGK